MTDRLHDQLTVLADQATVPPLDLAGLASAARARMRRRRAVAVAPVLLLALASPFAVEAQRERHSDDRLSPNVAEVPPALARTVTPPLRHVVQFEGSPFEQGSPRFDPPTATVGKDITPTLGMKAFSTVAVAFDAVGVSSECITDAALQMPPARVTGDPEIRVYPSAALSLAEGKLPPDGERPTTLIDNRPYGQTGEDGSARYDVTDLVRLWTAGGPFPSLGKTVPERSPIVLLLRPPAMDDGTYSVTYDLAEAPPRLTVTLTGDCGMDSGWDPAGTAIAVPAGWEKYSETHEDIPPVAGEQARTHSWRYAADPAHPSAAAIELNVVEGVSPLPDLRTLRDTEPDARPLPTTRQQQVILVRDQARNQGLTIASWDERPGLQVSVIVRGDVDLETLTAAVNSVVVAP